jgi:hypothetical protein
MSEQCETQLSDFTVIPCPLDEPMTETEFRTLMSRAMKHTAGCDEPGAYDYYKGYARGLRRRYHGDSFGTTEEHNQFMAMKEDPYRRHVGRGYSDGVSGREPWVTEGP